MQQPEEAAAEPEAQRGRGLRLVHQRGVVEPQLVQRVAQQREVGPVDRVQPGVDHGLGVPVPGQRIPGRVGGVGHRVADPGLPDVLHAGDQVADLAHPEAGRGLRLGRDHAHLEQFVHLAGEHHPDPLPGADVAVDDADVGDHAAVGVVHRVEDQRAGRGGRVADRGGHLAHDHVEQVGHALAGLGTDPQHVVGVAADDVRDLGRVPLRLRGRQVDLVQYRDDVQVVLQRQVQVGQRLRLDALRGVHQQHRTLAGGQRPGHLVGEVHVAGGVDEVQHVVAAVVGPPRHPHALRLDGDAALALDVHPVQVLRPHLAALDHAGELQHPVGQRGLAVVDVGDDAEVADHRRVGQRRHLRTPIALGGAAGRGAGRFGRTLAH